MTETSLSLLRHLQSSSDSDRWQRLDQLYAPLIRTWLRKYEVQDSDSNDLVQEVLIAVAKDVSAFQHGGQSGAFRGWLRAILVNRLRKYWRNRDRHPPARGNSEIDTRLAQLEDPAGEMSLIWNQEHDRHVLRQLLALAEPHFEPVTWKAFCRVALEGVKADVVAAEMGISLNSVCLAKSRVIRRLRQESDGLVDSPSLF